MATPKLTQAEKDYQLSRPNETWAHRLDAYRITITVIVELAIVLRMWGRRQQKIALRSDDYTLIVAGILVAGHCACGVLSVKYGYGHHTLDIPKETYTARMKAGYAANIIYAFAFPVSRISLILLYKRVFLKTWFAYVCWFMIFAHVTFAIAVLICEVFNTIPIAAQWNQQIKIERSIRVDMYVIAINGFNLGSDVILLVLPLSIIWRMHMRKLKKAGVSFIFCLGALTLISATMRLYYAIKYKSSKDPGWTGKNGSYWTVTELSLGLLCPCLVTFRPIIRSFYRACLSLLSPSYRERVTRITGVGYDDPSDSRLGHRAESAETDIGDYDKSETDGLASRPPKSSDVEAHWHTLYRDKTLPPTIVKNESSSPKGDESGMTVDEDAGLAEFDPRNELCVIAPAGSYKGKQDG